MLPPDRPALREALFEHALDAIVVADESGSIVLANGAVGRLLGFAPSELLGQPVEVLVPGAYPDHAALRASYTSSPAPRAMGQGILLFARHVDGSTIPVDISLTPLTMGDRRFVAAAMRDLRGRSYGLDTLRVQATALRSAANGVVITDHLGVIIWVNPAACAITGYSAAELVGHHTRLLKSGQHGPDFYERLWRTISQGETWSGTIVNRRRDGTLYHEEQTIAPVLDESGHISHFIAIKQDVTTEHELQAEVARAHEELAARMAEIEALNRQLREQAVRDPLTQLHNRRYLDESIGIEMDRAARERRPLCIAMLDLDRFKEINDTFGHTLGDLVLKHLADSLRRFVRSTDLVCRIGGEEFVVVMPGVSLDVALERAESWRVEFGAEDTDAGGGVRIPCTLSIGVVQFRDGAEKICGAIARADAALYQAKQSGRNRVVAAG